MSKPIQVSASILCANFTKLGDEVKKIEDAGVDIIHIDVMDGHFVPNITIGPIIVEAIRPLTKLPIEAHLMIENPSMYIDKFIKAGEDVVSLQIECYGERKQDCRKFGQWPKEVESVDISRIQEDIGAIHNHKKKIFLVINPGTPLCLGPLVKDIDGVLIMAVNPGFANQKFMPIVIPKIHQLRSDFDGDIAVDGGINNFTAPEAVKAGANILVTASYFFGSNNPKELVKNLKKLQID